MADFRKWVLAFAVVALLSALAVPASAQLTPNLTCVQQASNTPTVRAEGLAERIGDIVINCTGGTSTATAAAVPSTNITIFFGTNYTGRITNTTTQHVEALLMIDEPHSPANPAPLVPCTALVCGAVGTGNGANTYLNGAVNVWQARLVAPNAITFFGVPIDPPGTNGIRTIRITNLVANANQLGVSATLIPNTISAFLSINPTQVLPIPFANQTLAFVQRGLIGTLSNTNTFTQCNSLNTTLTSSVFNPPNASQTIRFQEGFGSAFKERNIQTHLSNAAFVNTATTALNPPDAAQDVPNSAYWSETGFFVNGISPNPLAAPSGFGPFLTANAAFPSTNGLNVAGSANQGTRLMASFASIPNGVNLWVPNRINLVNAASTSTVTGFAQLVTGTNANGEGGTVSLTAGALTQMTVTSNTAVAVYEVMYDDPFSLERADLPLYIQFTANPGNNLPQPGVTATVATSFAPLSNVGVASSTAPIPRFVPSSTPLNSFSVVKCSCNILFPFVTNQLGYDTGIAISNTSADIYGTTPQTGTVTLNYFSGGTPPPAQTTNANVPAGQQLLFTLSGGGNFGITPTPGFQGYIIAQAQFQYCHAFAYISAQGALPTAPGASEAYLGLILDASGLPNRPGQLGEVLAH